MSHSGGRARRPRVHALQYDPVSPPFSRKYLADPALRTALLRMVRGRVPVDEAEDIVQTALTEALTAAALPGDAEDVRKFVWGIVRHKVVDFHRRGRREAPHEDVEVPESAPKHEDRDLLRWAARELPEGEEAEKTLDWMLREGDGEKLESIAHDEKLPAPRVRQRVSRLRRHLKMRWALVAATLTALLVALGAYLHGRPKPEEARILPEVPSAVPTAPDPRLLRAKEERERALALCESKDWGPCVEGLDHAAKDDPDGDKDLRVVEARKAAADAMKPPPAPLPMPSGSASPSPKLAPTAVTPTSPPPSKPAPFDLKKPVTKTKPAGTAEDFGSLSK